jgi:prepilin-type N-terminal cleavage/methylation domain-containing protein
MKLQASPQSGLTLIEVVIGMALLSAALLITALSYSAIVRLQQKGASGRTTQQNGRYALESIERDVRNSTAVSVPSSTSIILGNSQGDGGTVRYSLSNEQLIRSTCVPDASGNQVCADVSVSSDGVRVTSLSIQQVQATGGVPFVQVSLRVEQKIASLQIYDPYASVYNLTTTVAPRYY